MKDDDALTDTSSDDLRRGDQLAADNRWLEAIDLWERSVQQTPSMESVVVERLAWFLRETDPTNSGLDDRRLALPALATIAALLGTGAILIANDPGSTQANLLAAAAWVLYALSGVLVVVAARGSRKHKYRDLLLAARARTASAAQRTISEDMIA